VIAAAETQSGLPRIPFGDWVDTAVSWITSTFAWLFDLVKDVVVWCYDQIDLVLSAPPFWVIALVLAALAFWAKGWRLGLGALVGFAVIDVMDQWSNAMDTLALVILASVIALVIGIPLLRLRTHYLAMATLAFGLILNGVSLRWIDFTGGTSGLAVKPLVFFGQTLGREAIYCLVLFFAAVVLLLHDFIIRSHVGRALQAIGAPPIVVLTVNVSRHPGSS
jgi:ABC-type branched-subunit amino acid transport system permease subunit